MKKSKLVALSLTPVFSALLASCGGDDPQSRDVYATKDECIKDWNDGDLCEQMDDADDRSYNGGTSRGYFWGPVYYPGSRTVVYRGNTITPTGRGASLAPFTVSSKSSAASRSSKSTPSARTTGFGGRSFSSGS